MANFFIVFSGLIVSISQHAQPSKVPRAAEYLLSLAKRASGRALMTAVVTRAHTRGTAWNSKATDSEFFTATNAIFVRRLQLTQLLSHGERQFV
jgi:hypothetical protein